MNRRYKRYRPRSILILLLVAVLLSSGLFTILYAKKGGATNNSVTVANSEMQKEEREVKEYKIESGDTFGAILESFGIAGSDIGDILAVSQDVYDFTKIKAGQLFKVIFVQNAFAAVEYVVTDHQVVTVEKSGEDFAVEISDIKYDITPAIAEATITSSLFLDASSAGLEDKTIMELAEVFGWDIDFATDIRKGDSFEVLYEKRYLDGNPAKSGKILAARFINQGETYWAIGYEDGLGGLKYYDRDGNSLAKQFLKSPLTYKYISTQYTNSRINPVTKKVDTHKAIDYAAPAGTPIVASADGVVAYADWKGGYGIDVEISHEGSYGTLYAHLSRIAKGIKNGVEVKQGQVIGYVGSTGISTGPHLHFAMYRDGTPLNPLTAKLPPGKAIESESKADFNSKRDSLISEWF